MEILPPPVYILVIVLPALAGLKATALPALTTAPVGLPFVSTVAPPPKIKSPPPVVWLVAPLAVLKVRLALVIVMPPPEVLLALLQNTIEPLLVRKVKLSAPVDMVPRAFTSIFEPEFVSVKLLFKVIFPAYKPIGPETLMLLALPIVKFAVFVALPMVKLVNPLATL